MWFAVLLRDGPERDLSGNGPHPESGDLDTTQTLVSGAWREVQRAGAVATDAHPTRGRRHGNGLGRLRGLLGERQFTPQDAGIASHVSTKFSR